MCADTQVVFMYQLLSLDFNQNWDVSMEFRKIPKYKIRESVQWFSNCCMRADMAEQTGTFLQLRCELA